MTALLWLTLDPARAALDLATGKAVAPEEGCAAPYPVKLVDGRIYVALAGASCACG